MASNDRPRDDLTMIKGIGPARQRWLRESLNVRTFQDLAGLEPQALESQLKAQGQVVSRSEIESWVAQARERAEAHEPAPAPQEELPEVEEVQANSSADGGEWRPFASFVVEFQTRTDDGRTEDRRTAVHYVEADRTETWSGIAGEQLLRWMGEQAGEQILEQREAAPAFEEITVDEAVTPEPAVDDRPSVAQPGTQPTMNVDVDRVRAFQPARGAAPQGIGQQGQPFSGFIKGGEPVTLEVAFDLAEPSSSDLVREEVTYRAEFRATNLSTHATVDLGSTEPTPLRAGQAEYTATLTDVTLQLGLYRLRVLTVLERKRKSVGMGYLEVPLLQVV